MILAAGADSAGASLGVTVSLAFRENVSFVAGATVSSTVGGGVVSPLVTSDGETATVPLVGSPARKVMASATMAQHMTVPQALSAAFPSSLTSASSFSNALFQPA